MDYSVAVVAVARIVNLRARHRVRAPAVARARDAPHRPSRRRSRVAPLARARGGVRSSGWCDRDGHAILYMFFHAFARALATHGDATMVRATLLARVNDGLPLAESLDASTRTTPSVDAVEDGTETAKRQAKALFKKLSDPSSGPPPSRMTIETTSELLMHYVIHENVCYLCVCDRTYPKKLAYAYLEELQNEFSERHGEEVGTVGRPYAFIKFDTFIQRTKKLYSDARTQRNLNKLNDDLHDIQQIMTRNINDIMGQGERLDRVSAMSGNLSEASKKYSKKARDLSRQALIQKYMPLAIFCGIVILTLMLRRYVFTYG